MTERYLERKSKADGRRKKLEIKSSIIANFRLAVFAFLVFLFFRGYHGENALLNILMLISIAAFIILIMIHNRIKESINLEKMRIEIAERHIKRISGDWRDFPDTGDEFQDSKHPYTKDLDVFGKNSVFQLLNRTHTHNGRLRFAENLKYPDFSLAEIKERSEGIEELSGLLDFTEDLEAVAEINQSNMKDPEKLLEYAEKNSRLFSSNAVRNIIRIFPLVVISGLVSLSFTKAFLIPALLLFLAQIIIWFVGVVKNQDALSIVNYLKYNLITYAGLMRIIEKESFKSSYLKAVRSAMFKDESSSLRAINMLSKLTGLVNLRVQGILNVLLNAFLLWDYQCVFLLEDWKSHYGNEVRGWLNGIGELEALSSFAEIGNVLKGTNFSKISEGKLKFQAKGLGHPLIADKLRVANDITLDNEILIITGSNMSGKTTFLRTIGINLILAYNGARSVCEELSVSKMSIYTSMRVVDDLGSGVSTFYAEILRIKEIIDAAAVNPNQMFLIDEIFRGTNSADRIAGAKNVILNLKKSGAIGAISTHDLELSRLDDGKRIVNYHFADTYDGDTISFDYKIKRGPSTATNAKNLMKLAGIPMQEDD